MNPSKTNFRYRTLAISASALLTVAWLTPHPARAQGQTASTSQGQAVNFTAGQWKKRLQRDSYALAVVAKAEGAFGGSSAIQSLRTSVINGTLANSTEIGSISWVTSGQEWSEITVRGPHHVRISTGHSAPFLERDSAAQQISAHAILAMMTLAKALNYLSDALTNPNISIEGLGSMTVGGIDTDVVEITSETDPVAAIVTRQVWYFSRSTHLPVRLVYRVPDIHYPQRFASEEWTLSQYATQGALTTPYQIIRSINGAAREIIAITTIDLSHPPAPASFEPLGVVSK